MAASFYRMPLVVVLGIAIARLAHADTLAMAQVGSLASSEAGTVSSQFSRSSRNEPPLRLALALDRDRPKAAHRAIESIQQPAAVVLTAQTGPLRSAVLARLQEPAVIPSVQAGDVAVPPQKTRETVDGNVPPRDAARTWEITPGDRTLNTTLSRWSASAGWQLVWDLEVDYPIETRAVLQGSFEEAVATVAQSLAGASVPIQATFYAGNKVLRIVAKGSK